MKYLKLMALYVGVFLASCDKTAEITKISSDSIELKGELTRMQATAFQYGTHLLTNETGRFALKSSTVTLDAFSN